VIYLDYNATTPVCDQAREAMLPYLQRFYGNPSSIHTAGREARAAVDNARNEIAGLLGAKPHEIIFTSGGTEGCNMALFGLAGSNDGQSCHVISAKAEHHAVLNPLEYLEKQGRITLTWLEVSSTGLINLEQLADSIRPDTRLVSIMAANNETGVIQPMKEISRLCRDRGVLLHSDMVQSFGKMAVDISLVDAASFAAHKFYGPKGAGFLYLRSGLSLQPIMFGGAHENQRRPGTENVAGIAGMAAAAAFVHRDWEQESARQSQLRDRLAHSIRSTVGSAEFNGDVQSRLGNTLNVSFEGLDSEMLLIALDLKQICASSGSACMVGSTVASHVLIAMGLPVDRARSAVRFSLGKYTTNQEIEHAGKAIATVVERLTERRTAQYAAG
jgi:cysteine desulfurase